MTKIDTKYTDFRKELKLKPAMTEKQKLKLQQDIVTGKIESNKVVEALYDKP